uniref:ORFIII-like polyprotein n=1 Tax=Tanacetum cinerariifolium TaxID=118510 RepID=A0A699GP91_TANCI|nr:ORFIII-like polyprotein [Tanacetum cinerariifolium]
MCKDAALAKELKDLSLCSAIPIPGYYKNNGKKYGIRKSRTYKGKPHNSHVKPFKRKYKDDRGGVKKYKCFIYEKEGHFAKDYKSKKVNIARSTVYQELDLDDNWDIASVDFDNNSVYNILEGECDVYQNISVMVQDTPFEEATFMTIEGFNENMVQSAVSWKPTRNYQPEEKAKEEEMRHSKKSLLVKDLTDALNIIDQLKVEQIRPKEQKNEEIKKVKTRLQKEKEKETEAQYSSEEFPPLRKSQIARPFMEAKVHYFGNTTTAPKSRKITNQIYNVKIEFEIPIFQRKMDKYFKGIESFIAVYINDILVFSKNEKEHAKHLEKMLKICKDNGLVLSPTKMKIAVPTIDFLGAVLEEGTIKLQPHIIKKIMNFNEEELKTKKGLRRNEAISSNNSLLNGGSPTVPLCLLEEYEDHMRRSHEDFQPLPRIFTKAIFTHEEPGSLYKHYQLNANQTSIEMDKSNAWRTVTQYIEVSVAKEAVKAMRSLQAIIQYVVVAQSLCKRFQLNEDSSGFFVLNSNVFFFVRPVVIFGGFSKEDLGFTFDLGSSCVKIAFVKILGSG